MHANNFSIFPQWLVLDLGVGKEANRLITWETIQKENFLTEQSKIHRGSDSERLKRMSAKWDDNDFIQLLNVNH